jgi:hypothetical protein
MRPLTGTSALVVDALAVARLTRLVTRDRITKRVRRPAVAAAYTTAGQTFPGPTWDLFETAVVTDDPDAPDLAYLLSCDWCSSVWVAALVVAARALVPGVWDPIARILAASQVTGMAAR